MYYDNTFFDGQICCFHNCIELASENRTITVCTDCKLEVPLIWPHGPKNFRIQLLDSS